MPPSFLKGMLYFAYGSNLLPSQVEERVPGSRLLGSAELFAWRFGYFRKSRRYYPGGAADIKPDPNSSLYGALWDLPTWQGMDKAEGVGLGAYERIAVEIEHKGKMVKAQSYTACQKFAEICPRKDYWEKVIAGAQEIPLPQEWLFFLEAHYQSLLRQENIFSSGR